MSYSISATAGGKAEVLMALEAKFAEEVLKPQPVHAKDQEAVEQLKVDGMSFKMKARMQAEGFLATSFAMVTNPATSDAVRADLIKNTVRWAGYDAKAADVGQGNSFNIQINLG